LLRQQQRTRDQRHPQPPRDHPLQDARQPTNSPPASR
jgi:hypothetical protein